MKLIDNQTEKFKIFVNIIVLAISLYGVARQDTTFSSVSPFEGFLIDSFAPLQQGITTSNEKVTSFFAHYMFNVNASKTNVELVKEVDFLNQRIFELEETRLENGRLKELLGFVDEREEKRVIAQIVAFDASSEQDVIRINKGKNDGLKIFSPVVTAQGLVGYVYRLTNHYSDILTIVDPNNRVDAIINRIRSHGIVEGASVGKCIMKYISRTEPVILGDLVVTSGLGRIYPKGLAVGKVTRIEREAYGITQYIEVSPIVNFRKIEEVVVLLGEDHTELESEWRKLDSLSGKSRSL